MDGKGRCLDNIPIERFWRTVKYEEVYFNTYETVKEARESLDKYIEWYNLERRHSGISYQRPYEVMIGKAQAVKWPFQRIDKEGNGYADNTNPLPHIPISFTQTKTKQQKEKTMVNLSSRIAA